MNYYRLVIHLRTNPESWHHEDMVTFWSEPVAAHCAEEGIAECDRLRELFRGNPLWETGCGYHIEVLSAAGWVVCDDDEDNESDSVTDDDLYAPSAEVSDRYASAITASIMGSKL